MLLQQKQHFVRIKFDITVRFYYYHRVDISAGELLVG